MDSLKNLLAALGMGDGENNTSNKRVILTLIVLAFLLPRIMAAVHGQPVEWTEKDLGVIALLLGGGIGNTIAEAKTTNNNPTPPKPTL